MTPLLSLRGISKSYGPVEANRAVDLSVAEGSIHAVLGENGAGKSTLMKLIYGVEAPDAGSMEWRGQRIALDSPAEARRLGIGMVFQHFSLFETLTVTENMALIVPGRQADLVRRIRTLGEEMGLDVDPHALVHGLSVGERQRVEILRCLMLDPRLLILDEPTSVLPPQAVSRLFDTLRRLRDGGVSVLLISHKLEEIRSVCDTATVLRAGRVTGVVDPREASARELARMMIGREIPPVAAGPSPVNGACIIEVSGLVHAPEDPFGVTLHDINLVVNAGEIVGIAGVSGNGQKELAALISGEVALERGAREVIRLEGVGVGDRGVAARRRRGFAYVPEERLGRGAVPDMSLTENAALTGHAAGGMLRAGFLDRRRARRFAERCIDDFDVRASGAGAPAGTLSGGNVQKFIVGREMMQAPRLLLLAQPTWGIDIGAATAIRQRLVAMRDQGAAILVISEEIEELFEICTRIHVLYHGRLSRPLDVASTSVEEVGEYMMGAAPRSDAA